MNTQDKEELASLIDKIKQIININFGDGAWQRLTGLNCAGDSEGALKLRRLKGKQDNLSWMNYTKHVSAESYLADEPKDSELIDLIEKHIDLLKSHVELFRQYEKK